MTQTFGVSILKMARLLNMKFDEKDGAEKLVIL